MCLRTRAARCSARTVLRAERISPRRSEFRAAASGSMSPPDGSGRYDASSPTSRSSWRDFLCRKLRHVFTVILYSQVLKALSPLKLFMLLQTRIHTSWLASRPSSLPSVRRATRCTRPPWVRTSFENASTSPLEARATSSRSPVLTRGRPPAKPFERGDNGSDPDRCTCPQGGGPGPFACSPGPRCSPSTSAAGVKKGLTTGPHLPRRPRRPSAPRAASRQPVPRPRDSPAS